ncbi:MAG: PKD domain-containing protein [Bacteroidota bacterium]
MKKTFAVVLFLLLFSGLRAQTQIAICPQISSFSSMSRGYYFTAPCNFTICGLFVPTDISTANQSVAVVRFTAGAPPAYSAVTNSFIELFYQPNYAINAMIPCNVTVNAGDIIGVYGSRAGADNSYGATNCATTILGNPVTLYRSGMQFDLGVTPMHDIWYENGNIGRVFMYINCCPTADFTVTSPVCLGQSTTATYTGSGTPPTTTFSWSFPGGTPATASTVGPHNITYSTAGTHTVSLTVNQTGCTPVTTTQNVVVNANPTVTVNSPSICTGQTATLTAGGAATYNWNTGSTSNPLTVSPGTTTTYTVTGTSAGCTGTATSVVTVSTNPAITVNSPTICAGQTATLTAGGATTYSWNTGSTANPLTISPGTTTTYTVTGTSTGCTGTGTGVVTVTPNPVVSTTSTTICAGQTGTLTASGATTYGWDTGFSGNPLTASPATTTTYTVTGTQTGCTGTASGVITVTPLPNAQISGFTDCTCGLSNGTATATGGTSYLWSNSQTTQTATGLSPGSYTCTVTSNGCSSTVNVTIGNTALFTLTTSVVEETCGQANGSATVTPSPAGTYTYLWSNGQTTQTATGLTAGTYTVSVSDPNNCTVTATVSVVNLSGPTAVISNIVHETCSASNGILTVTASGGTAGYTYLWSNGQTTQTVQNLQAGNYTITVTDQNGCTVIISQTINNSPAPVLNLQNMTPALCGQSDGSATITLTGGAAPLTFQWNNGQTSQNLTNVSGGVYTLIVTDNNGCRDTLTVTVNTIGGPSVTVSGTSALCDQFNGTATVNVSGGSGTYTYLWNNGQTTQTIQNLPAGTYSVTVSDGNCTGSGFVSISNIPGPTASFTANPTITTLEDPEIIFFNGSTGATSYQWSFGDGSTSTLFEPSHAYTAAGSYTIVLTVNNNAGCADSTQGVIIIKEPFAIWVPNAFTPDGDGINDYFGPKGTNFDPDHFEMYIYNRWGEQLFSTTNVNYCWDGRVNGTVCKQDVYIWMIILKVNEHKFQKFQGHVTIIR